jgi:adenylate cyclase
VAETPATEKRLVAAAAPHRLLLPHRVLLVDDQPAIGAAVQRLLADQADMVVAFCRDAAAAVDTAAAFCPTVILQDLVMPGQGGLDLLARYRAAASTAHVPVIMLCGADDGQARTRLLDAGANDWLVKLPDALELAARIRVHSESYRRLLDRDAALEAVERAHAELAAEREKSERLLRNMLPERIAARLKAGETTIADAVPAATVLFADLSGFTTFSAGLDARRLVFLLDEIFSAFDSVAAAHGVEKIKTIGDCYMAVAGLSNPRADHADAVAGLAVDLLDAFAAFAAGHGLDLGVRIGIHSGPVVAGVIGHQTLAYDLWGDTVNVASRMESHGEPGRIHVTAVTRLLLGARYRFEHRGAVEVKGRGRMETFFLLGPA